MISDKRTIRLKTKLLSSKYELCYERIKFFTEIYEKFPNDPEIIKRSKALAHTLNNMTIFIREDELLVGNETSKNLGEKLNLDLYSYDGTLGKRNAIKKYGKRKVQPFLMEDDEIDGFLQLIPFWKDKALYSNIVSQRILDENLISGLDRIASAAPNIAIANGTNEGHICVSYKRLLKLGYSGIINEVQLFQSKLPKEDKEYQKKYNFYEAVKIHYNGAIQFARRYSELAYEMADNEPKEERKRELEIIGGMMDKFTNKTADSFYEAVQLIHFTQNIINIIYQRSVVALGRLDQILWPYYEKDSEKGVITRD
ncbi:MAG: pyruvate formate lyase family protein, partial [Promethearchaeota archaeon]